MVFRNKNNDVLHDIVDVKTIYCTRNALCCGCEIYRKKETTCREWIDNNPKEAAKLMGWEEVEEELENTNATTNLTHTSNIADLHTIICNELSELYAKKNADYGDSFHQSFEEEGWAMVRVRLGDKFNRMKSLTKTGIQNVKDESLRDTLIDLANYAILSVMEIDRGKSEKEEN